MIELIKVGNGTSDYPGNFTKKEIEIIRKASKGKILHLFSGASEIGDVRVDFNHINATINEDVFLFLQKNVSIFGTVIIDAPYNQRFADKYQKIGNTPKQFIIFASTKLTTDLFNAVIKISPKIVIIKSWNYYCLKGYDVKSCYICYAGGYRKATFLIIMESKQSFSKK